MVLTSEIDCPFCGVVKLERNSTHPYKKLSHVMSWYYCPECDKNYCYDKMKRAWLIDPYDYEKPEEKEE